MREWLNDFLRSLIGISMIPISTLLQANHWLRIAFFQRRQRLLRRRYQITSTTPIVRHSDETPLQSAGYPTFASTSGSTSTPKKIPYTPARLRSVRFLFIDFYLRAVSAMAIRRRSLYILASIQRDTSLSSLLLEEKKSPHYFVTLQAPYRLERGGEVGELVDCYGLTATRLLLLALSNPGVLYATNPSTLSSFLDQTVSNWKDSSRAVRKFCRAPYSFPVNFTRIMKRIASKGWRVRFEAIASAQQPLPVANWIPSLEAYICWTGGYVEPFLARVARHLPPSRYRLIPMYSLSTETVETIAHFSSGKAVAYLPLAPKVLYEFLEKDASEQVESLLLPKSLQKGKIYSVVVSNGWGLRRYQTDDLFLCTGFFSGLPNLLFVGRRGLQYSFTGEKLTVEQVVLVLERLREGQPLLAPSDFLTCFPSWPPGDARPHYKLVRVTGVPGCTQVAGASRTEGFPDPQDRYLARRFERFLSEINSEYRAKRKSGRLGPIRQDQLSFDQFVLRVGGEQRLENWQSQFKFLPFYPRLWERLCPEGPCSSGPADSERIESPLPE